MFARLASSLLTTELLYNISLLTHFSSSCNQTGGGFLILLYKRVTYFQCLFQRRVQSNIESFYQESTALKTAKSVPSVLLPSSVIFNKCREKLLFKLFYPKQRPNCHSIFYHCPFFASGWLDVLLDCKMTHVLHLQLCNKSNSVCCVIP